MKNKISSVLIVLIFVGITYVANLPPNITPIEIDTSIRPDFQLKGAEFTMLDAGQKKWSIKSKDAKLYLNSSIAILEDVNSQIETPGFDTQFESPRAQLNLSTDKVVLNEANGQIQNNDQTILISTQQLELDSDAQKLIGHKNVTLSTFQSSIIAKKFEYDIQQARIKFIGNPEGRFFLNTTHEQI